MTDYILSLSEYDVCSYIYTTGDAFLVSICSSFFFFFGFVFRLGQSGSIGYVRVNCHALGGVNWMDGLGGYFSFIFILRYIYLLSLSSSFRWPGLVLWY